MNSVVLLLSLLGSDPSSLNATTRPLGQAPSFAARASISDDIVVHRAREGHTHVNGVLYRAVIREDLERRDPTPTRADHSDSTPIREVRTVVRLDGPFMLWLDPKRNEGASIGDVERREPSGPAKYTPGMLTLGATSIPASSPLRSVVTTVDAPGLRIQSAPAPTRPPRAHGNSIQNSVPKNPTTVR